MHYAISRNEYSPSAKRSQRQAASECARYCVGPASSVNLVAIALLRYAPEVTKAAIDAFWAWWPSVKEELNRRLSSRLKPSPTLAQAIREHVEAISPDLVWELGTGTESAYQFCLSAQGDRLGRLTTQRWLERAPERDATWEFHAARQPVPPGASLRFADKTFPLEDFVFTFEEEVSREMLRLVAHHPSFPEIEDESLRAQITCLALDQTFGEDGVDRWISVTDVSGDALDGGVSLQGLRDAVTSLA